MIFESINMPDTKILPKRNTRRSNGIVNAHLIYFEDINPLSVGLLKGIIHDRFYCVARHEGTLLLHGKNTIQS